jgi:hypothetical protein
MSEIVKLSWKDLAVNETSFYIRRGASDEITTADPLCLELRWNGTSWVAKNINNSITNVTILDTAAPEISNQVFIVQFQDNAQGTFYYGVSAGNASGQSDYVPTSTSITIQ